MQISEVGAIFLLIFLIVGGIGFSFFNRRRKTSQRLGRLKARDVLGVETLVDQVAEESNVDKEIARRELLLLADALSVPPGLLRPEDVVEELIGEDYFAGDAVLEIESRLQALSVQVAEKLTVREVLILLARSQRAP